MVDTETTCKLQHKFIFFILCFTVFAAVFVDFVPLKALKSNSTHWFSRH